MSVDRARGLGEQVREARLRLADSAAQLGTLLGLLGEHGEAEDLLRQAIAIYESSCGAGHVRLAAPLSALGAACAARGRLPEAERLCRRALEILGDGRDVQRWTSSGSRP